MDSEDKINAILDWAEDKDWFDKSFVEDMSSALDQYGSLTDAQDEALDNIIEKFRIV